MLNNRVFWLRSEMTLCTFLAAVLFGCGGGETDAGTTTWTTVAAEGGSFSVSGTQTVRYGANTSWAEMSVTGAGQCTNAFFGKDPAAGVVKSCQLGSGAPATAASTGSKPTINRAKIPTPAVGFSDLRVSPTTEVAPPANGEFRTSCTLSHMAFDDPIVFPGQLGRSHLHTFFGNTGTNANSTPESLRTTGNSTCRGGIANRSAYWVPTMIDTQDGTPLTPDSVGVYYKNGRLDGTAINPIPAGLRMIAGDPTRSTPNSGSIVEFKCIGGPNNENDKYGPSIGNCDVGAQLWQEVMFPQCWDGVNLDSPDHKSHMSYPIRIVDPGPFSCPSTHPVAIPHITFNVIYNVTEKDAPLRWRLASDQYDPSLPGGYSSHGDWFNGWKSEVSDAWANNCVRAKKDCHSHLLGDGQMIY